VFLVVRRCGGPAWRPGRPLDERSGWDEHATFMDGLVDEGVVVLGGPVADGERVVLAMDVESEEEARSALAADPWSGTHLVVDSVDRWTIRLDGRQGRAAMTDGASVVTTA